MRSPLRPAYRMPNGKVTVGGYGQTHNNLPNGASLRYSRGAEMGFVDSRGRFLDREQAEGVMRDWIRSQGMGAYEDEMGPMWAADAHRELVEVIGGTKEERQARAAELRAERRSRRAGRKSNGGGDVQVGSYTREGHEVSAYTRSRPTR